MKKDNKTRNNIDRAGIGALTLLFSNTEWAFREEPITDIGIDAQLEIIENGKSTGQLIALQVKSGESFFIHEQNNNYVFYVDDNHINYWFTHNLPVVLILYHPTQKKLYWSPISMETVTPTEKGNKVYISKEAVLTEDTYKSLKNSFLLHNRVLYRFSKLENQIKWMRRIENGIEVSIEFSDYVNKSLSRTEVTISCYENGKRIEEQIQTTFCPGVSTFGLINLLFPWADIEMNIDKHRENKKQEYEISEGIYDPEDHMLYHQISFEDWYQEPEDIVPIKEDGEIDTYDCILKLNNIGKSFLAIYKFLNNPEYTELKTFTYDDL